jgi:hypothetical protein
MVLRENPAAWRRDMIRSSGLSLSSIARYTGDVDRFVA